MAVLPIHAEKPSREAEDDHKMTQSLPVMRHNLPGALAIALLWLTCAPCSAVSAAQDAAPAASANQPAKRAAASPSKTAKAAQPEKSDGKDAKKSAGRSSGSEQAIVALVNDEPITGYEVQQRAMMLAGGSVGAKAQENFKAMLKDPHTTERLKAILEEIIKANPGKTKQEILAIFEGRKKDYAMSMQKQAVENAKSSALPGLKKTALDELIDEKLKLQEAKRTNAQVTDEDVEKIIDGIAERNKMTKAQLASTLGGDLGPMKQRIRSTLSFNEVIRRKFGHQITVSGKDVDRFVASAAGGGEEQVELQVQRITLTMPAKMDQAVVAQRVKEAEGIRAKFKGCATGAAAAQGLPGVKFENIGKRMPGQFPEPTRTMLLNAKDGEMLPPSVGTNDVELWAVCSREVVKAEEQKRNQAEGELKQKEFELIAKRHIKDLRTDAHIEYR